MPFNKEGEWVNPKRPKLTDLFKGEEEVTHNKLVLQVPDSVLHTKFNYTPLAKQSSQTVDIVIPIYRAPTQVKECVESIFKHTNRDFHLYLVDDYSNDPSIDELLDSIKDIPNVTVLKQEENRGFASTVNLGVKGGKGDWVCILNSDVLVTPNWLSKCIAAGESDKRNVIVNPVTNNTALVNVPMLEGCSYYDMNRLLETASKQEYPEVMPTGFCFIIKRKVLECVGYLDEGFHSYGEETDLWVRVLQGTDTGVYQGWRAVLAEDTYLFHERGASFSVLGQDSHMSLRQKGNKRFHERNPSYSKWAELIDTDFINKLRALDPPENKGSTNVLWLVTDASQCGGMDLVTDYINGMIEDGWNAKVGLVRRDPNDDSPPNVVPNLRTQPMLISCIEHLYKIPFEEGVVVASTAELLTAAYQIKSEYPGIKVMHHIQSDDISLTPDKKIKKELEQAIKEPGADYVMSASNWVANKLYSKPVPTVLPGVDKLLFRKRPRTGDKRPTVLIHINKAYPFKGYDRAVKISNELIKLGVRVLAVGDVSMPEVPDVIAIGKISKNHMANLLAEVDLVIDPSHIHSYGMPQAEAMASELPFVCWDNIGCGEFSEGSALIIGKEDEERTPEIAREIYKRTEQSNKQRTNPPLEVASEKLSSYDRVHGREWSTQTFVQRFKSVLGQSNVSKKKIVLVTPHVRKHGGPTTIIDLANQLKSRGHTVLLTSVYSDYNPEVLRTSNVPVNFNWSDPIKTDLLICNGDSDKFEFFQRYPATKKIMLKLSHNQRFIALEEQGLSLPWDHIMTSTDWLKDLCVGDENKVKQWDEKDVTTVGWRHYTHDIFDNFNNRTFNYFERQPLVIGTLYHAHPTKGTKDAVEVMELMQQKHNSKIVYVGEVPGIKGVDGSKFIYKPNRQQMANVMKQCDIWVVASHTEGLGRLALEAASSGAALVCTDTGSPFLEHNSNCLLTPVNDVEKLGETLEQMITCDDLRASLRSKAYQMAVKAADPDQYIDNVETVIAKVFNEA